MPVRPKPKVIAFITSYFPSIGGAEVGLRQVAKALSEECDFAIVTASRRAGRTSVESCPEGQIWRLGIGSSIDKWLLPLMAPIVRRKVERERGASGKAIMWGVDITQASLLAALVSRSDPSLPLVLTVQYGEDPKRLESGRWGLIRASFDFMLRHAAHVTAISTSLLESVRRHGYDGPASLIPNGVDLHLFRQPAERSPRSHPTVITVSRLVEKNGIDTLVRALALLVEDFPTIECRVIGDGPQRRALENLACRLGISGQIQFAGEVPHERIPCLLWESDVFVRPARSEGMGNAFVEALAAGVPIIGTDVGGIPDIIHDGETGLLTRVDDAVDLARKIRQLLGDHDLAARLSRQGSAWIRERYDLANCAQAYAAVFDRVLAG